jgi:hypothetical protein
LPRLNASVVTVVTVETVETVASTRRDATR